MCRYSWICQINYKVIVIDNGDGYRAESDRRLSTRHYAMIQMKITTMFPVFGIFHLIIR